MGAEEEHTDGALWALVDELLTMVLVHPREDSSGGRGRRGEPVTVMLGVMKSMMLDSPGACSAVTSVTTAARGMKDWNFMAGDWICTCS